MSRWSRRSCWPTPRPSWPSGARTTPGEPPIRRTTCCRAYGTARCNADRLPARALEDAVVDALHRTYKRRNLLAEALAAYRAAADHGRPEREEQLRQVEGDIARSEDSIDRYLLAFEAKILPEASCAERGA